MPTRISHKIHSHRTIAFLMAIGIILTQSKAADEDSGLSDRQAELKKEKEKKENEQKEESDKIKAEMDFDFTNLYDKLVIVTCESKYGKSSSSGFIAKMNEKTYLFTCKRVMFGADKISFKTAEGAKLSPRSIELSATRDMARMLLADKAGFETSNKMAIDQFIGIFGNSEGGGVVTELYGKIETMGVDSIEVSAPFITGNSGSPVLNANQEVVGIASHVKYSTSKDDDDETSTTKTRRFCHRLNEDKWLAVNWKQYNKKFGQVYLENEQVVTPVFGMIYDWVDNPYGTVFFRGKKDPTIQEWMDAQNRLVERLVYNRKYTSVSRGQLNSMNRKVQMELLESSKKLALVCDKYAKKMQLLKTHRDPTGFLQQEFGSYHDRFKRTSKYLISVGEKYASENYYSFK